MAKHVERKRGERGRIETLRRKEARRNKYAMLDLSADLLARVNHA